MIHEINARPGYQGSHACKCGRTISGNKESCAACLVSEVSQILEVLKQQEAEIPAGIPVVHVLKTDENSPPGEIPIS